MLTKKSPTDFNWLREQSADTETTHLLTEIEEWWREFVLGKHIEDTGLMLLQLKPYKLWLRKSEAAYSIRVFTQIFKDKNHTLVTGFDGKDAKVVIDLGANVGYYTLKIKDTNPACRVVAVEPNPTAIEILEKNIVTNDIKGVTIVKKAIGGNAGELVFKTTDQGTMFSGRDLGKIKKDDRYWIEEAMIRTIQVPCITLAELLRDCDVKQVDILKLDVENMELEIFQSSLEVLKKVKRIVVEWHTKETKEQFTGFLQSNGFELVYEEAKDFGDLYFVRIP